MENTANSAVWTDQEFLESTSDPNISVAVLAEEIPTLTVTTIVGVTVIILITIAALFLLGVFFDYRQQRLLERKMAEAKRLKTKRRVNVHPEDDSSCIANNMEETGMSVAPAEALRNIP